MNEAVQLFLLEGGAEAVASGVTLQADGAGVVGDGVPAGEHQDRWRGEAEERVSDDSFRNRRKATLTPCLSRAVMDRTIVGTFARNIQSEQSPPSRERFYFAFAGRACG